MIKKYFVIISLIVSNCLALTEIEKQEFIKELYDIGAIKKGDFVLKSGTSSPIYCDMRMIMSYPKLLQKIAAHITESIKLESFDHLCGVPYGAIPLATAISLQSDIGLIMLRKERKAYGTGNLVEGHYTPGQTCLLIEDVITTGGSIQETINMLAAENIIVKKIIVLIDRQEGGVEIVRQASYDIQALCTLDDIQKVL